MSQAQTNTLNATPVATITCLPGTGSTTTLTLPVYAFTSDLTTSLSTSLFTVYTNPSYTNLLLGDFFFNNFFNSCTFSPTIGTYFGTVKLLSVSVAAAGPGVQSTSAQAYTSATFSYGVIGIGSTTALATPAGTTEDTAKALAAHKAAGLALPKASN